MFWFKFIKMNDIYIIRNGVNLRSSFENELNILKESLYTQFDNLSEKQIRYSPNISATIDNRRFSLEIQNFVFYVGTTDLFILETEFDNQGNYYLLTLNSFLA